MAINSFWQNSFGANAATSGVNPGPGLMGTPPATGNGLFGRFQAYNADPTNRDALSTFAAQMLAGSGYSPVKQTGAEVFGRALLASQQARAQAQEQIQKQKLQEAQIANLEEQKNQDPNSVREYEYARQNGFQGSFQDWVTAGGQSSRPSSVQEWDFYSGLTPEQQQRYLEMKRNPNMFVKDVNTAPTVITGTPGGGAATKALSTPESEAAAAAQKKRQESEGATRGTAEGAVSGGVTTKGANAVGTKGLLDIAEPLIDIATGSATGAAKDAVAAFFGESTSGAQAIAQLQVLQAGLMTQMPRMEGPQSDRDVELYRQAAGQIGDPKVPRATKKAALKTIREIQNRYVERAAKQDGTQGTAVPVVRKKYNPATGKIE
jgi:hypothetical protein